MNKDRMNEASRHYIACSLNEQKSIAEIARDMGKAYSTIAREIERHYIVRRTGGSGRLWPARIPG